MKGFLSVLNVGKCAMARSSLKQQKSGLISLFSGCSSSGRFNRYQPLLINNSEQQRFVQTNSVKESSDVPKLSALDQSMLQGIVSFTQSSIECYSSGDYIQLQKRYEQ